LLQQLQLKGKFVTYIGTHGMAHGLEFIVRCLARLLEPNMVFVFVGSGSRKDAVRALAVESKIQNAVFLDPFPELL
jgi:hypothetical protein